MPAQGFPNEVVAQSETLTPINFNMTNNPDVVATSNNYVFSLSGSDNIVAPAGQENFYALAGTVTIDANGNILGGEQDYNNGTSVTSPQPSGDVIEPKNGALVVNATTGTGTLTLTTNNTKVGVKGVETFRVQFVNSSHALITQFDGSATSSGTLDLQTQATIPSGNFAVANSGVDTNYYPLAWGGVFKIAGTTVNGARDVNDALNPVTTDKAFSGALSDPDSYGRGTFSISGDTSLINYYVLGPEVIRLIDVDTKQSSIGSAYGQGTGTFTKASLGRSVLAVAGNSQDGEVNTTAALLGQFTTNTTAATFSGVTDWNEFVLWYPSPPSPTPFSGTYTIASNGYGSMSLTNTNGDLGDFYKEGIYMTDPALNLSDPNNPSGGGGALVVDLSGGYLAGTTGVLVPQTDTITAHFSGNYAVG